ncbi:MAG: hypothetical protein K6T75_11210 [Acetobacteraceae bacterium]|nr:hypothetical protein [Acetobacteraceae bacterium]
MHPEYVYGLPEDTRANCALVVEREIFLDEVAAELDHGQFELHDLDSGIHLGTCRGKRLAVVASSSVHISPSSWSS